MASAPNAESARLAVVPAVLQEARRMSGYARDESLDGRAHRGYERAASHVLHQRLPCNLVSFFNLS